MGENLITLGYSIVHKSPDRIPNYYSPELKNFIVSLMNKCPSARPKIQQIFTRFPEYIQLIFQKPKPKKKFSIKTKEKIRKLNFMDNYSSLKRKNKPGLKKRFLKKPINLS